MNSHTRDANAEFIRKPRIRPFHGVKHTYVSVSDPEEDVSSGMESFDEDDIYDGSENSDDIIYEYHNSEDLSPLYGMVRLPVPHRFRTHHLIRSFMMGSHPM